MLFRNKIFAPLTIRNCNKIAMKIRNKNILSPKVKTDFNASTNKFRMRMQLCSLLGKSYFVIAPYVAASHWLMNDVIIDTCNMFIPSKLHVQHESTEKLFYDNANIILSWRTRFCVYVILVEIDR